MFTQGTRPAECKCFIKYNGEFLNPSEVGGDVCAVHAALGLSIVQVHALYVDATKKRREFNVALNDLAKKNPEMLETLIRTENGNLKEADVQDAAAYPEDKYPRLVVLKDEFLTSTSLKADGSLEVVLKESSKKAELEAALRK